MKIQKRVACIAIGCTLAISMTTGAFAAPSNASRWFYSVGANGVAFGDGVEAEHLGIIPNSLKNADMTLDITRKEMCEIAMTAYEKINGKVELQSTEYFTDTNETVCAAYELGIVQGYSGENEGKFLPDRALTRREFFVILANLNRTLGFAPNGTADMSRFQDTYKLEWAYNSANQAVLLGAVTGTSENGKLYLRPWLNTTREQAIAMFMRDYKSLDEYYTMVVNNAAQAQIDELTGKLLNYAQSYLGTRYIFGGTSPNGFDCSGFTQYCYRLIGININRTAQDQWKNGVQVSKDALRPGDLVYFANTYYSSQTITHVGIYMGDGKFIHAANSQKGVIISSLSESYYSSRFYGARHILN